MDKEKISEQLGLLLEEPTRDFKEDPITPEETLVLIEKLFHIIGDPKTPEDAAHFYMDCLQIVKMFATYN